MKPMQEIETLAIEIADAARTSFRALFENGVTITVRYILLARDMRQASPPGRGKLWRWNRPGKETKVTHRDRRLRNSSNGPMPIRPIVVSGMRTSIMLNNDLSSVLSLRILRMTKGIASLI